MSGYKEKDLLNLANLNESDVLQSIIHKLSVTKSPVTLGIVLRGLGLHSVVAFDLEETDTGYTFQVYDCSLSDTVSFPVTVKKKPSELLHKILSRMGSPVEESQGDPDL